MGKGKGDTRGNPAFVHVGSGKEKGQRQKGFPIVRGRGGGDRHSSVSTDRGGGCRRRKERLGIGTVGERAEKKATEKKGKRLK